MFVTFLSDFGLQDDFVGTCHGVIKRIAPEVQIIDVTHGIPPQQVLQGALVLASTLPYMPVGVHLAVVDPGVGSSRRPLALRDREGRYFVGPDNGLLVPAADLAGIETAHELANPEYALDTISRTFHGRDLFAPVAGHLAAGVPLERLGPPLARLSVPFVLPPPRHEAGRLSGEVLHVDTYGNLVTNLPASVLPPRFTLHVGASAVRAAPHPHYQAVAPGTPLALVGSAGLLEVSVRDGNAAAQLGAGRGSPVTLEPDP